MRFLNPSQKQMQDPLQLSSSRSEDYNTKTTIYGSNTSLTAQSQQTNKNHKKKTQIMVSSKFASLMLNKRSQNWGF